MVQEGEPAAPPIRGSSFVRKQTHYTVTDKGRDQGKTFQLTEMACDQAEKWAMRALGAAARSGLDVSGLPVGGMASIASIGIEALFRVPFEEVEPLLNELFSCVKIIRDPRHPGMAFALTSDDIEEIPTRLSLRWETLKLHVDFSKGVAPSRSTSETAPKTSKPLNIKTSPRSSGPSSRIVRRRLGNAKSSTQLKTCTTSSR